MTTRRLTLLRPAAVALTVALLSLPLAPAQLALAKDQQAFSISDSRVTRSSGLTRDVARQLYWTANDAGAEGTVFGVTARGVVQGVLGFRAHPADVEAVAMHNRRLYVADIGDRARRRSMITVYYFDNPQADNLTVPYRAYDFAYPDGPHDAATLLVDGSGRLYVVTREQHGAIYAAPRQPARQGVNMLRRVADAPAYVTDGVFLPTGNRIVLRTYGSLLVLDGRTYRTSASAATPWQKQGESVAVSLDGRSLLLGSMGKDAAVISVGVPRRLGQVAVASSTPPPSPAPTPSASASEPATQDAPPAEDPGKPISRNGTLLALSLAGLVALVAGVVVVARRR